VNQSAHTVAIRNEVIFRIDGVDTVGEDEAHYATFAKACM
jgi:hypothetical protein